MKKLENLFEEERYNDIFDKLAALVELRDNVLQRLQSSNDLENFDEIKREFQKLENFENKYYATIFEKIGQCVLLSKENSRQVREIVKVLERGDDWLVRRGKEP